MTGWEEGDRSSIKPELGGGGRLRFDISGILLALSCLASYERNFCRQDAEIVQFAG
jgi:hypothetical protein